MKSRGSHDFDCLAGEWNVRNRRLKTRFAGSNEWDEFPATLTVRPILGGTGNVDEIHFSTRGYSGATLRLFNPKTNEWSIYWMTDRTGVLEPPVVGHFEGSRGEFYGDDVDDGKPIRVRYIWSGITGMCAHWEQAFSLDHGNTWETNWTMEMSRIVKCCPVIELRQYEMKPGRRDELIDLFDEHFIEGQEKHGTQVIGQFRDRNNPERFVWMRGFADMEARRSALEGFYDGPIWLAHRTAANDTMLDSSNVLLLKPARCESGFRLEPRNDQGATDGLIIATIYHLENPPDRRFVDLFEDRIAPAARAAGATILAYFISEPAKNNFPRLPVREGENVFVWFASLADDAAYRELRLAGENLPNLKDWRSKPEEILELTPTCRSLLR